MSATAAPATTAAENLFPAMAKQEMRRYARSWVFLAGLVLTIAVTVMGPDKDTTSLFYVIVPAAGLGLFGMFVMNNLVRSSDKLHATVGAPVVAQSTRTLALAAAALVPFVAGLLWLVWAVWAYQHHPTPAYGLPFGPVGDGWVYGWLIALGPVAALGGSLLGLLLARWVPGRWAPAVAVVLVVFVTICCNGIVEPLRPVRTIWFWTYFGGPLGVTGDSEREILMTGSPQWYVVYLLLVCAVGVVLSMMRDRDSDRRRLARVLAVLVVLAVAAQVLTMTSGVQDEVVNPHRAPAASSSSG